MAFLGFVLGMVAAGFWMIAWGSVIGNVASVVFGVLAWFIAFCSFVVCVILWISGFETAGDFFKDWKQKRAGEKAEKEFEPTTAGSAAAGTLDGRGEALNQLPPEQSKVLSKHAEDVLDKLGSMQESLDDISKRVSKDESPAEPIEHINADLSVLIGLLNEIKTSVNALPAGLRGLLEAYGGSLEKLCQEIKSFNKDAPDIVNSISSLQSMLDQMHRGVRNIQGNVEALPHVQKGINARFAEFQKGFGRVIDVFNEKISDLKKDIRSIVREELSQREGLSKAFELFNAFNKSLQDAASKLNTLIQYFIQVQAQALPWQEKMVVDRAKKELDSLLEVMLKEEEEMFGRISEFEGKLKITVEKLQAVSARLRAAPKAFYVRTFSHAAQWASVEQRDFSEAVHAYKRALTDIGASLVHVSEDLLVKKVNASEIGALTRSIIAELQHSLDLIGKLNSKLVPALNDQMKSIDARTGDWVVKLGMIEKDLIPVEPVEPVSVKKTGPVAAKPALEMTSNELALLLQRVEATLDKLDYMSRMPNLMKDVEAIKETKTAFEIILRFYKTFERALQSGKMPSINRCRDYEKRIVPYLHHFNSMLVKLSAAPYKQGGSEYEDIRFYVRKRNHNTKNPYYTTPELSLPR